MNNSVTLVALPIPPSANALFATAWKTKRRFKSKDYKMFDMKITHWKSMYSAQVADAREFVSKLSPGEALKVDCVFYFPRSSVLTKKNTVKRHDVSNYLKALHDAISDMIDSDDSNFFSGSFDKRIINSDFMPWCDVVISIVKIEGW